MQALVPPLVGRDPQARDGGRVVHELGDLLFDGHPRHELRRPRLEAVERFVSIDVGGHRARLKQRLTAEALEVAEALLAPRRPLPGLLSQLGQHGLVSLVVDLPLERLPSRREAAGRFRAAAVMADQLLPERAPRPQRVVPGQTMEPEQELLRRRRGVGPLLAQRRAILIDRAAPLPRAVVADA